MPGPGADPIVWRPAEWRFYPPEHYRQDGEVLRPTPQFNRMRQAGRSGPDPRAAEHQRNRNAGAREYLRDGVVRNPALLPPPRAFLLPVVVECWRCRTPQPRLVEVGERLVARPD